MEYVEIKEAKIKDVDLKKVKPISDPETAKKIKELAKGWRQKDIAKDLVNEGISLAFSSYLYMSYYSGYITSFRNYARRLVKAGIDILWVKGECQGDYNGRLIIVSHKRNKRNKRCAK